MKKRQETEAFIITYIDKLLPNSANGEIYRNLFSSMNDQEFDLWIKAIGEGSASLCIIAPGFDPKLPKLEVSRNFEIAKELGHNFFERLWIDEGNEVPAYLTNHPYLVMKLPLRRQAQMLKEKESIPENYNTIDDLTGQPTGPSKGSSISYPEIQILAAQGLDQNITEQIKYRGGDEVGFSIMNKTISQTGEVSLETLNQLGTEVKSTETLSTILTCMHLENTLIQK